MSYEASSRYDDYRVPIGLGLLVVLVNLAQAAFTPLDPDEAYYAIYASRLDWGYYDHPPMVALSIWLGQQFFSSTLGLRLGAVLTQLACMYVIWQLAGKPKSKDALVLAVLIAAMPFLQLYGFISTPDGPLLLAAACFWWAYRAFLQKPAASTAFLWGICMAFLLYSKYHGLLVIGFTVLSNFQLWRKPWFYAAGLTGVCLFLPHLYWQYVHDFPSFRYHLAGRDDPYEMKHTLNYLLNQLTMFNPLLLVWWVPALFSSFRRDAEGRAYVFTAVGFWLFFLWSTSKGHAEPQWTAILSIPIVVSLFRAVQSQQVRSPWLWRLALLSVGLFVIFRICMAWPGASPLRQFRNADWIADLSAYAGTTPVFFENSYRDASLYGFYTGKPVWNITNIQYRHSQYDLWDDEARYHNQPVIIAGQRGWPCPQACDTLHTGRLFKHLLRVDSFQAIQKTTIRVEEYPPLPWQPGDTIVLALDIFNPYPFAIKPISGRLPVQLALLASTGLEQWHYWPAIAGMPMLLPAQQHTRCRIRWAVPTDFPAHTQQFGLGWQYAGMPPSLHSGLIDR